MARDLAHMHKPEEDDRLTSYAADMLRCRATHHPWGEGIDTVEEKTSRGRIYLVRRTERCDRCTTERITIINVDYWYVVSRRYEYPEGYRLTGGMVDSGALRRELFFRTSNLASEIRRK